MWFATGTSVLLALVLLFVLYQVFKGTEKYTLTAAQSANATVVWDPSNKLQSYLYNKPGYGVIVGTKNAGTGFNIEGSDKNSIKEAIGLYDKDFQQFSYGYNTSFPIAEYYWSSKNSSTWDNIANGVDNTFYQKYDDMKGTLYRKSDNAVFSTWKQGGLLGKKRYWGFKVGGTPLAEFSCLALAKSGIEKR